MMSAISGGWEGGLIRHGLSHQTKLGLGARCLTDGVRPMVRGGGAAPGILMTSAIDRGGERPGALTPQFESDWNYSCDMWDQDATWFV